MCAAWIAAAQAHSVFQLFVFPFFLGLAELTAAAAEAASAATRATVSLRFADTSARICSRKLAAAPVTAAGAAAASSSASTAAALEDEDDLRPLRMALIWSSRRELAAVFFRSPVRQSLLLVRAIPGWRDDENEVWKVDAPGTEVGIQ